MLIVVVGVLVCLWVVCVQNGGVADLVELADALAPLVSVVDVVDVPVPQVRPPSVICVRIYAHCVLTASPLLSLLLIFVSICGLSSC